ncbi:transposase [Mesorhizobium sp. M3A.F.Ca.ET.201.01.1.1]|uniref:transposase n=1 Tax=Mesorhizobium sp. TaxID=1871066 RepID=UPI001678B0FA
MSGLDLTLDPERQPRRFEVINGAGGRRRWSGDDKARIIAETLEPNAIISEVARPLWSQAAAGLRLAPRSAQTGRFGAARFSCLCAGGCGGGGTCSQPFTEAAKTASHPRCRHDRA